MTELKPCPFCGGEAEIEEIYYTFWHLKTYYVRCTRCGCRTMEDNKEYAIQDWNRRINNG